MQEYLNENEIAKVEAFCKDEVLYNAVKKVLLQGIYTHGVFEKGVEFNPKKNVAFSLVQHTLTNPIPDAEIGSHLRSVFAGLNALENSFKELDEIRSKEKEQLETPYNIAE
jgi:hypothetical protein